MRLHAIRVSGAPARMAGLVLVAVGWACPRAHPVTPAATQPATTVAIAPAPGGEDLSSDYAVTVNGETAPVYRCRVSAVPLNQVWPGYQRPLDQTEQASFACWDMTGPVHVKVAVHQPPRHVVIRPLSLGITPQVDDRSISFTLTRPAHCTVEVDGTHHALHLFASPPEGDPPKPNDPGIRYFGPGLHRPGKIELQSNQTVYLAAGAVVHGHIVAKNAEKIRVLGRGILDASTFERAAAFGIINLVGCRDVLLDGIVLRDPPSWTVIPAACQGVRINNLKLIGLWRYNSDGIDVVNSQGVTISNCFIRSFDDSIVIKGIKGHDQQPVREVMAIGCVIWNDWNLAIEVGPETCAPEISNLLFRDCDIIRTAGGAMDVKCGDRARIHNVRFEDIRLEIDPNPLRPRLQTRRDERYEPTTQPAHCPNLLVVSVGKTPYSKDTELGSIQGVHFKNIQITGPCLPGSHIGAPAAAHGVKGVTIENVTYNGQPIVYPPGRGRN
jgi:hypothetical protein